MKSRKLPRRSFYWQNFKLTASVVLLTLLMLGASFYAASYSYAREQRTRDMEAKAAAVSRMVTNYLNSGSIGDMRMLAHFASETMDEEFLICNSDGNVLMTTDEALTNHVVSVPQEVYDAVGNGRMYTASGTLGIFGEKKFVVGVPIHLGQQTVGTVLAAIPAQTLTSMWDAFFQRFLILAAVVLLLAFLANAWVSMHQSRPIREMAKATRRFADGEFHTRMRDYGNGEIGELARSFNHMADSLEETERQRREFIANVSHELKTPMTTIAGYTDGILDGTIPPEEQQQYLSIISEESRRLSRLVRRMLEVSRLQSREALREKKPFDLCESMRRVLISLEKKITDRGLDVEAEIPDQSVMAMGDGDLITQVIYNLLENAAKFARSGSSLFLGLSFSGAHALVTVRNEGETIPPEEIPLLFERFHKSDRSRSEDKDGVGLGLYIVKTILEQHHEHILVTSENGVTTFTFTMQLASVP